MQASDALKEYLEHDKCGVREEYDESGHRFIAFAGRLPKVYPLLIGTGIHSLRSSLDTAISTLVQGVSRKESRTNFPFHQTEEGLRAEFKSGTTTCGGCKYERVTKPRQKEILQYIPELEELIFEIFKPWEAGNYSLWALNKIDNIQKHRMLILAWTTTSVSFDYNTSEGVFARGCQWILHPGSDAIIAESNKRIIYARPPHVEFAPVFPRGIPFAGEPIFEVLTQFYKTTRSILETLYVRFQDHPAMAVF